jgi:hypothetical protein
MGLDISLYKDLKFIQTNNEDDEDYDVHIFKEHFPKQCESFKEGYYKAKELGEGFRAGSYSGYNAFRRTLASLVGMTPERVWENPDKFESHLPFFYQIMFSDCEGAIDYKTAAKLHLDYVKYYDKAKEIESSPYFLSTYESFMNGFALVAKEKGVMIFC